MDTSKWTVSPYPYMANDNKITLSVANGALRIDNGGGSSGVNGIADAIVLSPITPPLVGDFTATMSFAEISRVAAPGQTDNSGITLLVRVAGHPDPLSAVMGVGIFGDNAPDLAGQKIHHAISMVSLQAPAYRAIEFFTLKDVARGRVYSGKFRLSRQGTQCSVAYRLDGDADWTPAGWTTECGALPLELQLQSFSGDGGGTTVNGALVADIPDFLVEAPDTQPPVLDVPGSFSIPATSPSGAVVVYSATASDDSGAVTLVCVPASGSTFPIGLRTVTCTASDASGNSATASFDVTVLGAADQIEILEETVHDMGLSEDLAESLENKLEHALEKMERGQPGCESVRAFLHQVAAQAGKHISLDQAATMQESAMRILAVLGCGN